MAPENGGLSKPCAIHKQEGDKGGTTLSINLEDLSGWSLFPVFDDWKDLKIITENLDGALSQGEAQTPWRNLLLSAY